MFDIEKDKHRAIRRHHKFRLRQRALRQLLTKPWHVRGNVLTAMAARRADNRAVCSCAMCGNPRRFGNSPTKKELIHELMDGESAVPAWGEAAIAEARVSH